MIAIGWIPLRLTLPAPLNLGNLGIRAWLGMIMAYAVGNHRPPHSIYGKAKLVSFLRRKDFRGAAWLFDVQLTVDQDGLPVNIDCDDDHDVGYTPYVSWIPGKGAVRAQILRLSSKGEGGGWLDRRTTPDGGRLIRRVEFRLGDTPNAMSRVVTGYPAPNAWMEIDYFLRVDRYIEINLSGSHIPSQSYYLRGNQFGRHEMEWNSAAETLAFLRAGDRVAAPVRPGVGRRQSRRGGVVLTW